MYSRIYNKLNNEKLNNRNFSMSKKYNLKIATTVAIKLKKMRFFTFYLIKSQFYSSQDMKILRKIMIK